ncbi:exonuclease subunit SbcD [Parendozoicomonas haliclonae]|uniref:Nuclease SbcCD subunit D n=1 Tax=Parendozoicomonas haliclonae TaxID=1960125 RepID=A0A1X7AQ14_9GAMM|nr:exonuclease subunit SbcD [Parendozoicomonas haliclonae]SMA50404.1 Nuclease SbcCD subunit D [Parendozoicomonas haliclonae]
MRILHTSDWHLGQHFMGKTREQEHRLFLDWLLNTVKEHRVDAVIIAGDVFDTGVPPSYARTAYNQFIVDLQRAGDGRCQLVVLGGNHDSVATLHESKSLLSCLNTVVVGGAGQDPEQQVMVLNDREGQPGAVLCAVPYIRPRDVLASRAGDSGEDKQQALLTAMTEHYRAVYQHAERQAELLKVPVVATGHLTTVGGKLSESVREIYIGTLSAFPASAFPPASYIALGHLHRGQKVSDHDHIRYSGSPIPLSFDECSAGKQVLLVDFVGDRLEAITELDIPLFRRLASLSGDIESLKAQLQSIADEKAADDLNPWVEIQVDDKSWINDLQSVIEAFTAELPVEVLRVRRKRQQAAATLALEERETLAELQVEDVFTRRLQIAELDEKSSEKLTGAFRELVAELEDEKLLGEVIEHKSSKVSQEEKPV